MNKNTRLTYILLQLKIKVEGLIKDGEYLEKLHELNKILELIDEAVELLDKDENKSGKKDGFDKVLKIVDLIIKFFGLKGLSDFL